MPLAEPASIAYQDALRQLARTIDAAGHGEKSSIKAEFAERYGISVQTLHRHLAGVGWHSGRRRRSDAGSTSQDMDALTELAATLKLGVRKNGKATMHTPNARSMLAANGKTFAVSNSRINELLRRQQLDLATQRQPSAHVSMRSLHPNHVHQVDPSLCLLYYLPGGGQKMIRDDEAYKNKPETIERIGALKVWRYVLTDHYSGTIIVRYYQARGETQENLFDFLLYAWQRLDGRLFHGVPKILVWDKGSANTAGGIRNALEALQVEHIPHQAGNARAKGQVENANNIVETHFESRLRYEPVSCVDELNAHAEAWTNAWNANAIPDLDSRLRRRFMAEPVARYALWQMIRQEQLRLLPDLDVCRYLLTTDPQERQVGPDLTVSFKHPNTKTREFYDLAHVEGIYPRCTVKVSPLIYGGNQVLIHLEDYRGEERTFVVDPIQRDAFTGFRADAPTFGESYAAQPDTVADRAGKAADRAAFPDKAADEIEKAKDKNEAPFGGLDAVSHLRNVYMPDFMNKRGTELHVPSRVEVEEKTLTTTQALIHLKRTLGRALNADERDVFLAQFPEGCTEQQVEDWARGERAPARPRLSVITGGEG